jgi:hypothetical protein
MLTDDQVECNNTIVCSLMVRWNTESCMLTDDQVECNNTIVCSLMVRWNTIILLCV